MSIQEILGLAQATRSTSEQAEKLIQQLGLTGDEALKALQQIRQFNSVKLDLAKQFATLNQELGLTESQFKKLSQVAKTIDGGGEGGLGGLATSAQGLFGKLGLVSFGFNQIQTAVQTMAAAARPAFDLLIGANEKLNSQLLSSQANLANATRIYKDGVELTDPTEKINASRPALKAALKQIEKDTVDLVGVTSADVNQLFQITLQNAAALNQQSKEFPKPIAAATALTKGWAASLKVMGIPLFQANQEINSIVKGQITQDSLMAKNLGINNEMVVRWRSQGVLVDELNKRLQTFVTANGIASRSIEGIGSNIQDTIEIIGREAGQSLLEPVIQVMDAFYQLLKSNKDGILNFITQTISALMQVGAVAMEIFKVLQPVLVSIGQAFLNLGDAGIQVFIDALTIAVGVLGALTPVLVPVLKVIADLVRGFSELINSDLGQIALLAVAITVGFAALAPVFAAVTLAGAGGLIPMFGRLAAMIPTLIPHLYAMAAGWWATLAPLLVAAAPLIAVAATIGLIGAGLKSMAVGDANEAIDSMADSTNRLADESLNTASKLKALQKQEADGKPLSEDQQKQKKALLLLARGESDSINQQITDLKALAPQNEAQRGNIEAQIKLLETRKKLLGDGGDIDLKSRSIEDLGTSYEQLAKKAAAAQKMIDNEGGGESGMLQQAIKDKIAVAQQQFELGQISAAEAKQRLTDAANNKDAEVATQQQAQDAIVKIRKSAQDLEKAEIQGHVAEVSEAVASGRTSEAAGAKATTALKRTELDNQLEATRSAILAEQNAILEGRGSTTKLKQLQQQEKQGQADLAKNAKEDRDRENKESLKDFDEGQKELDGRKSQGLVSEQAYADQSLKISEDKLAEELEQIATKRAALAPTDKEGNEAIDAQEAEIRKKQVDVVQKYGEQKLALLQSQSKLETALLEAKKSQGLVSEAEYTDQSLAMTQARLAKEMTLIAEARSRTPKGNTEAMRKLAIEEAEILKQQVDAIEKFEAAKLAILDRAQKKALDLVKASQTAAEIETQKLLNSREIREVEASDRDLKAKRKITEEELKLEQEKSAAISALPALSDPQKEEERQSKIRASRLRTGDLTLQLLKGERELQESNFKVISDKIDQELKVTLNSYTEQEQGLQRLSVGRDLLVKNLERQNALLTAQKELQSAISGYVSGEFQLAESLTQSEFKKHKLREEAARARLAFLDREQEMERQSLDLEQAKNTALLEREKIQNRIAQSKADAGLAKAIAEQAKTAADPKATAADKNAAALSVQAAQDESIGTKFQGKLLDQQNEQDAAIADAQRRKLDLSQELKRDQARGELAKETIGKQDDIQLANEAEGKARNAVVFSDDTIAKPRSDVGKYEDFYKTELAKLGGRPDNASVQQQINRIVQPNQAPVPFGASIQQPLPTGTGQAIAADNLNGLKAAIAQSIAQGFATLKGLGTLNQTNSIVTNLNGVEATGKNAAENVNQQILNTLYGVGILAKAQKATN